MKLCDLLANSDYEVARGDITEEVESIEYHSEEVKEGSAFFAIDGSLCSGYNYIEDAIKRGARAIVLSKEQDFLGVDSVIKKLDKNVTVIKTENVRKTLATMSAEFYNNPSGDLQVIGVTGTKGKTTTTFMIRHILEKAGIKTGIIGTVVCGYDGNYIKADATTPQAPHIQAMMRKMVEAGCKAVVMEVSSQGLKHSRVEGIQFNLGVLTNIAEDHIGGFEHENFEEYIECKSKLFDMTRRAVINGDCKEWQKVVKNTNLKQQFFYGSSEEYDYPWMNLSLVKKDGILGSRFFVKDKEFLLNIPGRFNVENAACAISVSRALGIPWEIIQDALRDIRVPGRVETVLTGGLTVMVDYAHNGMALKNLLDSLREYKPNRLMVVFGCGGNRDRNRRFQMGKTAFELADYIVVTSDNPRNEEPMKIIEDITSEMGFCEKVILSIPDRSEAIKRAIMDGGKDDIIVIAGKGHETYQIIGSETRHFDDKEVILSCMEEKYEKIYDS